MTTFVSIEHNNKTKMYGAERLTDKGPMKPDQYRLFIYRDLNGGSCRKQNLNYLFLHDERDGPVILAKKILEGIINIKENKT